MNIMKDGTTKKAIINLCSKLLVYISMYDISTTHYLPSYNQL